MSSIIWRDCEPSAYNAPHCLRHSSNASSYICTSTSDSRLKNNKQTLWCVCFWLYLTKQERLFEYFLLLLLFSLSGITVRWLWHNSTNVPPRPQEVTPHQSNATISLLLGCLKMLKSPLAPTDFCIPYCDVAITHILVTFTQVRWWPIKVYCQDLQSGILKNLARRKHRSKEKLSRTRLCHCHLIISRFIKVQKGLPF